MPGVHVQGASRRAFTRAASCKHDAVEFGRSRCIDRQSLCRAVRLFPVSAGCICICIIRAHIFFSRRTRSCDSLCSSRPALTFLS